ncbi:hypothetical protein [Variovorax atrisoli]|uniref:hypothetical protein n=1 Tax=Variovorax atrisoli TaxID=3394203 RepID=UPI0003647813|nr:hypothetical protein [Variovorax paradoxus]
MSLPAPWVERIFERLIVRYGRDFMARYEGIGNTPVEGADLVRADWARELDGFERHPALLAWALDHLPDRPPTAGEFKRLAKSGPDIQPDQQRLEAPRPASRATRERLIAAIKPALKPQQRDPRQWARDLIERHESGRYRSTPTALAMARDALREPAFLAEEITP